jgi:hypothetical protein
VAPTTCMCDLANMDAADARVSGPPVSAAAPASAMARVIGEVHADRFLIDLAVAEARPDSVVNCRSSPDPTVREVTVLTARAYIPPVAVVDAREMHGAMILDVLLDRMLAT